MENNKNSDIIRDFALLEELEASVKLIKLGFGELQNISAVNNFYYLPFQLLSSGFERLMKCHICLGIKNMNESNPDFTEIKSCGHDLFRLLAHINSKYFKKDKRSIIIEDGEFLTKNEELLELLNILSEFGMKARYHNMDIITNSAKISIDPKKEWQKFEFQIMELNPELFEKNVNPDTEYEVYDFISNYIIKIFERFLAALSRQFMFGFLGDRAKQLSPLLFDFGKIYEEDLGKTDYRKLTTTYKETPRRAYKRTFLDDIERKTNKNFRWKKISKSEYGNEWPFYADEVIIECRDKYWCIVTIDGYDYALNGSAKGKYKLDDPYEGGVVIPGKTFTELIKIAQEI